MTLTLVRGLPGSGKSTLARRIIADCRYHFEADQFWHENESGEYKFDAKRLPEAHEWCRDRAQEALLEGHSVVVSNTFTTIKELRPYFVLANRFDIIPTVYICQNQFNNIHNVPEETLKKMKARFAWDISELFEEFRMKYHENCIE
jgi:predicted kinase